MLSFKEAIDDSERFTKRHLFLGNGFSIACRPDIFHYGSLFGQADFSKHPNLPHVFEALGTNDFEIAINALERSAKLAPIYLNGDVDPTPFMLADAVALKSILIETVARSHPEGPFQIGEDEFYSCRIFLSHFLNTAKGGHVFTLNYDLLLYWTLMHSETPDGVDSIPLVSNDGFGNDEDDKDADYVIWRGEAGARDCRVFYLHGALQFFDAGHQLQKYTWIRKGERLVEQARGAMAENKFPLFVSEGTSADKLRKINHNAYLYQGYKVFGSNCIQRNHCFFIHGHSLAENDDHFLTRLGSGRATALYVGLFGDEGSASNQAIKAKAYELQAMRGQRDEMELVFYDSSSARVWG